MGIDRRWKEKRIKSYYSCVRLKKILLYSSSSSVNFWPPINISFVPRFHRAPDRPFSLGFPSMTHLTELLCSHYS